MTTKRTYIAPEIRVIPLGLGNEVMQHFNVTSDTINEGDAKGGFFDEEEEATCFRSSAVKIEQK